MEIVAENVRADKSSQRQMRTGPPLAIRSQIWGGQELGPLIAIDTETELVTDGAIPKMAMASVSDGEQTYIVHPRDINCFLTAHADGRFISFNVAFDFWVLSKACSANVAKLLWKIVSDGRWHDPMILDQLIRLGKDGRSEPVPRSLEKVAMEYCNIFLHKEDPHRLRYGELIGADWATVDRGFFDYAAMDAYSTWMVFQQLLLAASELQPLTNGRELDRCGYLTETLQVRSAIALADVSRRGIAVDQKQAQRLADSLNDDIKSATSEFSRLVDPCEIIQRDGAGEIVWTQSGKPSFRQKLLRKRLDDLSREQHLRIARTPSGLLSLKTTDWEPHQESGQFIKYWLEIERASKLRQFVAKICSEKVYPKYCNLKVTGRTSASAPNIQQIPRAGNLRRIFRAAHGHYFFGIDWVAVELVTLAATLLATFGNSKLADTLNQGVDPHAFTAAKIAGIPLVEFNALKNLDLDRFRDLRQKAKAINFGIPGGLGAKSLVEYARSTYGTVMTIDEAQHFRELLIKDIYPELEWYLRDDTRSILIGSLACSAEDFDTAFDQVATCVIGRILRGLPRRDGRGYDQYGDKIWRELEKLNNNPEIDRLIRSRDSSGSLFELVTRRDVATLSGRLRGKATYTQACNTPFQGLAADGAKLALWELVRRNYRVVAFVHDEFLIELPIDADHTIEARTIEKILCDSMAEFTKGIRIRCEYALMSAWSKDAKAVYEDGRLMPWSPPKVSSKL